MLTILEGDCRLRMAELDACSVDSCVTDPPYELGFMGKHWDKSGIAYDVEVWRQVLRVLKPGAHLLAFGGTRTAHRMAVAIEDAGFEIRDSIHWMYGSGFPKSLDISKAIDRAAGVEREVISEKVRGDVQAAKRNGVTMAAAEANRNNKAIFGYGTEKITSPATDLARIWSGWGTAIKPAHEIIYLCRKPLSESSITANVLKWGTGALNIDACRIGVNHWTKKDGANSGSNGGHLQQIANREAGVTRESSQGRWPANVILSHSPNCERIGIRRVKNRGGVPSATTDKNSAPGFTSNDHTSTVHHFDEDGYETVSAYHCHESCPVQGLDGQSGESFSSGTEVSGEAHPNGIYGARQKEGRGQIGKGDSGGASRFYFTAEWSEDDFIPMFYYIAKASRGERDQGLSSIADSTMNRVNAGGLENDPRWAPIAVKNAHPTVKPVSLMAYLCKLITPPGGTVLDCFAGSGTTGRAALESGFKAILIEQDPIWLDVINQRSATQLGLAF